jgi:uncharacterized protein (DUF433 family)
MISTFRTTVQGRCIQLPWDLGLAEGHVIEVTIKTRPEVEGSPVPSTLVPPVESWCDRLVFDAAVHPVERIVKGTRLEAEALVAELEANRSDEELVRDHPELTREDVTALRNYALAPVPFRRLFGAWAEDAEELDQFLEEMRRARKLTRRGIEE